jgi:hypothetical protein
VQKAIYAFFRRLGQDNKLLKDPNSFRKSAKSVVEYKASLITANLVKSDDRRHVLHAVLSQEVH